MDWNTLTVDIDKLGDDLYRLQITGQHPNEPATRILLYDTMLDVGQTKMKEAIFNYEDVDMNGQKQWFDVFVAFLADGKHNVRSESSINGPERRPIENFAGSAASADHAISTASSARSLRSTSKTRQRSASEKPKTVGFADPIVQSPKIPRITRGNTRKTPRTVQVEDDHDSSEEENGQNSDGDDTTVVDERENPDNAEWYMSGALA